MNNFLLRKFETAASLSPARGGRSGTDPVEGRHEIRRIFIDCTGVDFSRQPTGIPRVVRKYIEVGYAWAARRNVEIIPAIPNAEGLILCRPVPGKGAPRPLRERADKSESPATPKGSVFGEAVCRYLGDVIHHGFSFAAALLPVPPVKSTSTWADQLMAGLVSTYRQHIERQRIDQIRFEPRAGDVLFAPAYWHDVEPAIYRGYRARGMHIVILVHDLLPVLFENFYPSPWRYMFRDNVRAAFDYASAFLCVSNYTRAALREFGLRNRLNTVPMMTSYNGFEPLVDNDAAIEIKEKKPRPLMGNGKLIDVLGLAPLLMVGSVEPKKGHIPVIQCLESLWSAGYDRPLCIIGRTGWMERDVVAAIRDSFFFNKKIFWFSAADDLDLAYAYTCCHALIFSSIAEGFGLPMIEASYYGKPTVVLDTPIAREILGNSALLFDSAATFVEHLVNLEDDAKYRTACQFANSVHWPLWEDYTPNVFDHLARFLSGATELPEQVPIKAEKPSHLQEVSA